MSRLVSPKAPPSPDRIISADSGLSSLDVATATSPSAIPLSAQADSPWERGILGYISQFTCGYGWVKAGVLLRLSMVLGTAQFLPFFGMGKTTLFSRSLCSSFTQALYSFSPCRLSVISRFSLLPTPLSINKTILKELNN